MTATSSSHDETETDRTSENAVVSYDWGSGESLSTTIVSTISDLSGKNPDEIERLYDHLDPDSLESIFEPTAGGRTRNAGSVAFHLEGYAVTVHASGTIVVTRAS
ncbi:HalOD1 output domain-containing protein [Natrialbaceae archaeon A-arb3/5]